MNHENYDQRMNFVQSILKLNRLEVSMLLLLRLYPFCVCGRLQSWSGKLPSMLKVQRLYTLFQWPVNAMFSLYEMS